MKKRALGRNIFGAIMDEANFGTLIYYPGPGEIVRVHVQFRAWPAGLDNVSLPAEVLWTDHALRMVGLELHVGNKIYRIERYLGDIERLHPLEQLALVAEDSAQASELFE